MTRLFLNDTPVYKTNKSRLMSAHTHTHTHTQHICGQDYLSSPLNKAQHSKWKTCQVFTDLSGEVQDEGSLFKILSFTLKSKKPLSPSPESQIFLLIFENACWQPCHPRTSKEITHVCLRREESHSGKNWKARARSKLTSGHTGIGFYLKIFPNGHLMSHHLRATKSDCVPWRHPPQP